QVNISNNTFIDPGRIAILASDFVEINVDNNSFTKTFSDFGYGVEVGSESSGTVTNNVFSGFNTFASDNSNSAGVYVVNAFTGDQVTPFVKDVVVSGNEVFDSHWGIFIGNDFNTLGGPVGINITVSNNHLHDNTQGGIRLTDADASLGSFVNATMSNNLIENNTGPGYFVAIGNIDGLGDGQVSATISGDIITGNNGGIVLDDLQALGPSTSSYSLSVTNSSIAGNTGLAVQNDLVDVTVDASGNWLGTDDPTAIAAATSGSVDFSTFLTSGADTDTGTGGFQGDFSNIGVTLAGAQSGSTSRLQEALDLVSPGGTVSAPGGNFTENLTVTQQVDLSFDSNVELSGALTLNADTAINSPGSVTLAAVGGAG
ncbi:MAG: right-handed parallel beta-helix repeat-containing protein, partial [Gammaproteobacteria bacterium]|nr:right-handed parallel beta-helix repeat-containing protein [Gammaproteobacteria bacterium]